MLEEKPYAISYYFFIIMRCMITFLAWSVKPGGFMIDFITSRSLLSPQYLKNESLLFMYIILSVKLYD